MVANPRIDDLRRRLEREPSPRLQAQLAEELRKNGGLDEAIALSRAAAEKQPGYASARITLARALMDKGDYRPAAAEFEEVLRTAPDNILASRFLGECLEALGDLPGALARHQGTLVLLPGDPGVSRRVEVLAARLRGAAPPPAATGAAGEEQAFVDTPAASVDLDLGPLPADDVPTLIETGPEAGQSLARALGTLPPEPEPLAAQPPEVEPPPAAPAPPEPPPAEASASPPAIPPEGETAAAASAPPVATATLAELYAQQGLPESAAAVYRAVLEREPGNARARERLSELAPSSTPEAPAGDPRELRRRAIQDTITRLEAFLRSVRR
jgi:tetratricopeptide (TPR) repeat protein